MRSSQGTLLGGRVRYAQPLDGYRTGLEPVLLAACVPAAAGDLVLEAGTGAGAGLLCLASRVAGVRGVGVEIDAATAALARENFLANGRDGLSVLVGDVTRLALPACDHAMANPPWHDPASTPSPVAGRRLAKQEAAGVEAWVAALARAVRPGGSLTMIVPPLLAERAASAGVAAGLGGAGRLFLRPKAGRPAKIVVLQGWRGEGDGPSGELVLHEADGSFTPVVAAVLRDGAALTGQGDVKSFLPGP